MSDVITISDCMKRLEAGEDATLEVWTYDRKRKKGGDIETLTCRLATGVEKPTTIAGRELTEAERRPDDTDSDTLHIARKPNHSEHYTRNVRIVANGHPTSVLFKIHPPLIKSFNGVKTVP